MRRLLFLAILFFIMPPVFCQVMMNDSIFRNDLPFFQSKKFDYGFTLGSQFTSVSGCGSALNTYVAPHFSYNLNRRLSIGGGISFSTTNYFNARSWFQNEQSAGSNGNFTNASVFVYGQYLVNDRLTLYGSAFKIFPVTKDPLPYNPFNPVSQNGAQGVNFNVDYKIGEHMHIQAGFRYSQGLSPYNTNSYYNDPFQSGYNVPGFGFENFRY